METRGNLLIVAGAGRNVGKTEFVCRLIDRFRRQADIYGLKVSAIHPDEAIYHGDHSDQRAGVALVEETRRSLDKDTSRMLRAGARRVHYLHGDEGRIQAGFQQYRSLLPEDAVIVCESGSLWKFVRPGLLILITSPAVAAKPRVAEARERAALVIESDGHSGFPEIERIMLSRRHGWSLAADPP